MNIYWNRETIQLASEIKRIWGIDRCSQTNSKKNGCYGRITLYHYPADKGRVGLRTNGGGPAHEASNKKELVSLHRIIKRAEKRILSERGL